MAVLRILVDNQRDRADLPFEHGWSVWVEHGRRKAWLWDETLFGSSAADSIDARGGNDVVRAGGGNDTVKGFLQVGPQGGGLIGEEPSRLLQHGEALHPLPRRHAQAGDAPAQRDLLGPATPGIEGLLQRLRCRSLVDATGSQAQLRPAAHRDGALPPVPPMGQGGIGSDGRLAIAAVFQQHGAG